MRGHQSGQSKDATGPRLVSPPHATHLSATRIGASPRAEISPLLLTIVLLEPCFPASCARGLLWAGVASLAQGTGHFARQPERDDGTTHPPLPEPDARQLSRGVDARATHVR